LNDGEITLAKQQLVFESAIVLDHDEEKMVMNVKKNNNKATTIRSPLKMTTGSPLSLIDKSRWFLHSRNLLQWANAKAAERKSSRLQLHIRDLISTASIQGNKRNNWRSLIN
jgi:hypothetical protein